MVRNKGLKCNSSESSNFLLLNSLRNHASFTSIGGNVWRTEEPSLRCGFIRSATAGAGFQKGSLPCRNEAGQSRGFMCGSRLPTRGLIPTAGATRLRERAAGIDPLMKDQGFPKSWTVEGGWSPLNEAEPAKPGHARNLSLREGQGGGR
jgi:hypothetical protein